MSCSFAKRSAYHHCVHRSHLDAHHLCWTNSLVNWRKPSPLAFVHIAVHQAHPGNRTPEKGSCNSTLFLTVERLRRRIWEQLHLVLRWVTKKWRFQNCNLPKLSICRMCRLLLPLENASWTRLIGMALLQKAISLQIFENWRIPSAVWVNSEALPDWSERTEIESGDEHVVNTDVIQSISTFQTGLESCLLSVHMICQFSSTSQKAETSSLSFMVNWTVEVAEHVPAYRQAECMCKCLIEYRSWPTNEHSSEFLASWPAPKAIHLISPRLSWSKITQIFRLKTVMHSWSWETTLPPGLPFCFAISEVAQDSWFVYLVCP